MKNEFDAIIIGGGPGGLSIGTMLAKEGLSSVIIEKDLAPGGRYRSVDFHGARVDCAIHFMASMVGPVENTSVYQQFKLLGIPLEYKIVPWAMGLVAGDKPGQIEYLAMDPKLGAANFFGFFAFATGVEMDDSAKTELMRVADITADMTDEECKKVVGISFADWIDRNVTNPIAQAVMYGMEPIVGASPKDINFGYVAKGFGAFKSHGATLIWYPKNDILEGAFINPMVKYYIDNGGTIVNGRTVTSIEIEDGKASGVVAVDTGNRYMIEEYFAPVVICAIPIFEAVSKNILRREFVTDEWADSIERCAALSGPDLSGFFILNRDVVPRDGYGWIHVFDSDYGIPTYLGDLVVGSYVNAVEPPGKQLITSLVVGSTPISQFGLNPSMETVKAGHERWKQSVEKAFPGFNDAIEYEGFNLQLNFSRYAYAVVPTELDIQSPNIKGLYFGGDSVWAVGNAMSDKCFQIALALCDRVVKYIRS